MDVNSKDKDRDISDVSTRKGYIVKINISKGDVSVTGSEDTVFRGKCSLKEIKQSPSGDVNSIAYQQFTFGNSALKFTRYLPPIADKRTEDSFDCDGDKSELHSKITYIYDPKYQKKDKDWKWLEAMDTASPGAYDNAGFFPDAQGTTGGDSKYLVPGDTNDDVVISMESPESKLSNSDSGNIRVTPTAQVSPTLKSNFDTNTKDIVLSVTDENDKEQIISTVVNYNCDAGNKQETGNTSNGDKTKNRKGDGKTGNDSAVKDNNVDEETKWLNWMELQFKKIAGDDNEISLQEFKEALKVKRNFFAERFFHLFDQDGSGSIEMEELMDGLLMITKGTDAQKLRFLFDVYDIDGSGTIDKEELKTVLSACMEESSLSFDEDNLDKLTDALFAAADEDRSGSISFEELKAELEKHPGVLENLTISAAQWLKPPSAPKKKEGFRRYFTILYLKNNLRKVLFILWFVVMNIGLGAYAIWKYWDTNGFVIVARICGMNLNFTGMFVLMLMLRKCLTYLRETFIALILPLDQNILFHKMVGITITVYSVIHTGAHIGNAVLWSLDGVDDLEVWEILFTTRGSIGWVANTAYITGWPLLVIIITMFICSLPFVRRSGHFQVFYWTHMLYVPFWIILILHGPNFWKWFVAPGFMFLLEKIFRSKLIKWARYGKTYVEEVHLLPSGVCHLSISRPENFKYQPGDYIFIQIPIIATQEWHPFTISSAPEMKGRIWLHVRSAGHWTNKLYEYFSNLDPKHNGEPIILSPKPKARKGAKVKKQDKLNVTRLPMRDRSSRRSLHPNELTVMKSERRKSLKHKHVRVKCFIDGPYGTATREIFETEHAVLVGAGIGVTPMASILQSVMYRYKESKQTCPHCKHSFYGNVPETTMKLKKVDFIWINRDQKSFEWFVSLLNQLELEQLEVQTGDENEKSNVIDMHMYMTAAHDKTDMKGVGLQVALDLMHKKEDKDLITGLRTKTQPGRPNWNKLFQVIADAKKGKVKVFFCGAPTLGQIIKEKCMQFHFGFSKENF